LLKRVIDEFKNNDYENLADFVIVRREDVSIQFSNRVLFLARSLALNFHTRILKALGSISVDIARNTYNYREDPIEFITNIIFEYMKKYITMPSYVSVNPSTDYIFSYTATSSIIPMIISEVYDLYDEAIVKFSTDSITFYKNANDIEEKIKAAESIHLQMLNVILPIFESLNSQIEWLSYMVRDEARSIYRPMAMEEAGVILNNHLQEMKKHEEVIHGEHGDITIGHF
jgi:hypothetical protein